MNKKQLLERINKLEERSKEWKEQAEENKEWKFKFYYQGQRDLANEIGMYIEERMEEKEGEKKPDGKLQFVAELYVNEKTYELITDKLSNQPVILHVDNRMEDGKGIFSSGKRVDLKDIIEGGVFIS